MSILRYKRFALADGGVARGGDGGGGGGGQQAAQPTNTTVQNTNIPEYAQPYVETMLGTAQQQIFNYDGSGNVTGMKPYVPYSSNPTDYVAGFSPLQQQAQSNIANMQTPGQYATGTDYATTSGLGALSTANSGAGYGGMGAQAGLSYGQNATNPNAVAAYMNPYLQNTLAPSLQLQNQQFGQINAQNQGQATQQGAFGGGRQAVMQGLNQQNQMFAQNQLVGNAYNQAYNTANQNMQTAGAQAMQGAGLGLQGTAAQQAAYQQLGAQGANLANIAGQQTQSELGINAAQQASGAAQQAQQQNIINQQIQNYATAQQYPMMQLANMSGLLRGLPMQSATTQTYQAAPSAVSTLGGLGATALGAYGASGGFKSAKAGGLMESKSFAEGGAVAFDVGGAVEADLENMDTPQLMQQAKTSPSATVRQEAIRILTERQAETAMAKGVGAAPSGMQMAGGGIVAFEDGGDVKGPNMTEEEVRGLLNGRLPAGSAKRLQGTSEDLGDYADSSNAMGEVIPANASEGSFSKWWREHTLGTKENLGLPVSEAAPTKQAAVAGKGVTFDPTAGGNPAVANLQKPGLGSTPQAGGYSYASSTEDKDYKAQVGKLGTQIDKLTADLNKGLSSGKAQSDLDSLREEIKDKQDQKLWLSIMAGGAKAMASKSPFANVGIGEGVGAGVESYAQAAKAEREDKKLLIAQQSALEQAEYARKTGNLNALIAAQSRLDAIKQHRETLKMGYTQIGASKEATLEAAKIKAKGDAVFRGIAAGLDEDTSIALANRAYSQSGPAVQLSPEQLKLLGKYSSKG